MEDCQIRIGNHFAVRFQRTLRIPDDGGLYPLPPGLGPFPIYRVEEFADRLPEQWQRENSFFLPMYQREALWMSFDGAHWRPNAVTVGIGRINAITGRRLHTRLNKTRQNYVVCPDQPWLDGINAGKGFIRQFVAMPLGAGYTVEGQMTGVERFGGMQITAYDPRPGIFPDEAPEADYEVRFQVSSSPAEMGLGAGGRMRQDIYPDEYGVETWDPETYGRVHVYIVNCMDFREITGLEPPATPVTARNYTEYGLPWFDLYDEDKGDVGPDLLDGIESVKQIDKKKGMSAQQDDSTVPVADDQIIVLGSDKDEGDE